MTDLVSGGFQQYEPFWSILGRTANSTQGNVPVRSNITIFGPAKEELGTITSEKGLFAAIPVSWGDSISNVRIGVCTTEAESSSEFIAAIYEGVPNTVASIKETKVLGESAVEKVQIKKEKGTSLALKSSVLITPSNAPSGFVYAGFFIKETTATFKCAGWKVEAKYQNTGTTAKETLGAFYSLTEAATASFASAKASIKVETAKVSTEIPYIILT